MALHGGGDEETAGELVVFEQTWPTWLSWEVKNYERFFVFFLSSNKPGFAERTAETAAFCWEVKNYQQFFCFFFGGGRKFFFFFNLGFSCKVQRKQICFLFLKAFSWPKLPETLSSSSLGHSDLFASANILEDAVQDLVAQVRHSNVDVVTSAKADHC